MPYDQSDEVVIAIIAGTVIFLLFSAFCITYIVLYWKRKVKHVHEVRSISEAFREELWKTRLEIQEQTFTNISEEIHDGVGQSLSLATVQLSALDEANVFDRGLLRDARTNISQSLADLRSMAHTLSGERVKAVNLSESIRSEASRLNRHGLYDVTVEQTGNTEEMPESYRLIVFRLIQEWLQNILKHARASKIRICLKQEHGSCIVKIRDNGQGFDVAAALRNNHGLGLQNMKRRIGLLNGKFDIESLPGKGTTLSINVRYE